MSSNLADRIHVVFASDDKYVRYLAVAIASLLKSSAPGDEFDFYVLDAGIGQQSKEKIEKLNRIKRFSITYIIVDSAIFKDCPPLSCGSHTNVVTYYRFLLGDLLPQLDRVIYLDTDVIARQSIAGFWQTDIDNVFAAGVKDEWEFIQTYKGQMGFAPEDEYFNAGVLLLNLKKWRQENVTQKLFENRKRLNELKIFYTGDQDTFNYTFKGATRFLPWGYNVQQSTFWGRDAEARAKENEAYLIHYNGPEKPDTQVCQHAFRDEFWKFYELTEFYVEPKKAAPAWVKNVWVCHNKDGEILLRVFKMNIIKRYRKDDRMRLKILGVPVS